MLRTIEDFYGLAPGYPVTKHPSINDASTLREPVPSAPGYAPLPGVLLEY